MVFGTEEFNDLLVEVIKNGYRHSCYAQSVAHAKEMSWHFYGVKPEELLKRTRPNEDPAITTYRLDNYEPHTKSAADKTVNITSKIFNPNLYSIRWAKDKDNENAKKLKDATLVYFPDYNSIVNYTKDVVLRKMLADPNAVLCVKPEEMPERQTETPIPEVVIFGSENIWYYDDECYLIFYEKEKIGKDEYHIFEYFDKDKYIKFWVRVVRKANHQQTNNQVIILDDPYEEFPYQNLEEYPVWKLRGMSEALDDGEIIFKSYFYSAVPYWNDAIVHESDLKGAFIRHLFPQKTVIVQSCKYKFPFEGIAYPCNSGKIKYGKPTDKATIIDCPHCSGSGYEPISPYGEYRFPVDKLMAGDAPINRPPVEYINVPTDATKMLDERVDKLMQKGLAAINMEVEDKVGSIQSGEAKAIDRSAQYDMLYNIGSVIFDVHITNMFYYINKMMFSVESKSLGKKEDENLPEVNKPTQFDILTSAELLQNFKVSKESGLSPNLLVTKEQEILSKDLTTNPDLKLFQVMLLELDPLAGQGNDIIQRNVMAGFNSKSDAVIHFNLRPFVERAMRENKGFIEMDKDKKLEILNKYAAEFIKANKPVLEPSFDAQQA